MEKKCACGCGMKTTKIFARGHNPKYTAPLEERFWAKVKVSEGNACWTWTGALAKGYGRIKAARDGKTISAHRLSWELAIGPIPQGLFVCHRCDNPPCVRPDHLFLGTALQNTRDMDAKGRDRRLRWDKCKRGHSLIEGNIIMKAGGVRRCRKCQNDSSRAYWRRKAAQRATSSAEEVARSA